VHRRSRCGGAAGAGGICLVALLAVAVPLGVGGNLDAAVLRALVLGGAVTATAAVVVGLTVRELGRALSGLSAETAALSDGAEGIPGTAGPRSPGLPVAATAELTALAHGLDALRLRGQISAEVTRRQRHSAETAGAGMFQLLSGLVQAEEAARGQLAAELHDTIAQSLQLASSCWSAQSRPERGDSGRRQSGREAQ
jgi:signal transduction histidine kinase